MSEMYGNDSIDGGDQLQSEDTLVDRGVSDVLDELDSRAGLQPAHLIKWNPFLDDAAAVHELESCKDLVIGVLDHFLENEPSPNLHASTSLGASHISSWGDCHDRLHRASLRAPPTSTALSVRSSSQSISSSAKVRGVGFPQ